MPNVPLQFNLRETSNIIGNLCRMTKDVHNKPVQVGQALAAVSHCHAITAQHPPPWTLLSWYTCPSRVLLTA